MPMPKIKDTKNLVVNGRPAKRMVKVIKFKDEPDLFKLALKIQTKPNQ